MSKSQRNLQRQAVRLIHESRREGARHRQGDCVSGLAGLQAGRRVVQTLGFGRCDFRRVGVQARIEWGCRGVGVRWIETLVTTKQ